MKGKVLCGPIISGLIFVIGFAAGCSGNRSEESKAEWQPVAGKIQTRWAGDVSPDNVHQDYPRPQMKRSEWLNLNGMWEYAVRPLAESFPPDYDGHILVPFPIESALSGVGKAVGPENRLWYRRMFQIPKQWKGKNVILNFEAVDWETSVWVNGTKAGSHSGGYDPFALDISPFLKKRGRNEIVVSVWDPADTGTQPRGKQVLQPRGIWYTSVTGIWQTVWLEPVEQAYLSDLKIIPDLEKSEVIIHTECSDGAPDLKLFLEVSDKGATLLTGEGKPGQDLHMVINEPKLWSPDAPFLYDLELRLENSAGEILDKVTSYFGMRRIYTAQDSQGVMRLFLNHEPVFHFGPLDQGWWPDGLYTAPSDAALRFDIEVTKELGMNMLRKHVKIESRRFYYWCDKLGILVWQDMPSGDKYIGREEQDFERSPESSRQFRQELKRLIDTRFNHPSIVMWVPFNEGWGQFDTAGISDWIKEYDPTRLVNSASGWSDRGVGDVHDIHAYPGPAAPPNEAGRAAVLGEFGGLGLPVPEHTWQEKKNWGYRSYENAAELTAAYLTLLDKLAPKIDQGLAAAVYTQTTDVEIEVNGLMTYDRAMVKMDKEKAADANKKIINRIK